MNLTDSHINRDVLVSFDFYSRKFFEEIGDSIMYFNFNSKI